MNASKVNKLILSLKASSVFQIGTYIFLLFLFYTKFGVDHIDSPAGIALMLFTVLVIISGYGQIKNLFLLSKIEIESRKEKIKSILVNAEKNKTQTFYVCFGFSLFATILLIAIAVYKLGFEDAYKENMLLLFAVFSLSSLLLGYYQLKAFRGQIDNLDREICGNSI